MKLQNYLIEENKNIFLENLKKNCSRILKFYLEEQRFLYRSVDQDIPIYLEKIPRENRKPSNTSVKLHDMYDKLFKRKFGWYARSEGVFASFEMNTIYGKPYLFFPFDDYKYLWSDDIGDLFTIGFYKLGIMDKQNIPKKFYDEGGTDLNIKDKYYRWILDNLDQFEDIFMKKVINTYQNNQLENAKKQEIMFKCSRYYLVNQKYEDDIILMIEENY